jgi:hypothetical protein
MDKLMKLLKRTIRLIVLLAATSVLQSCVTGIQLKTTSADRSAISGTYTLLLYGCHYPEQIDNVAILVADNSKYPLDIYDLDTSFKVKKGVPGQQAVAEADEFVRCSFHKIWQTRTSKLLDDSGRTMGYEIRPLYDVTEFGTPDVLMINYSLKDEKVRAYIRKIPAAEDRDGDGRDTRESR